MSIFSELEGLKEQALVDIIDSIDQFDTSNVSGINNVRNRVHNILAGLVVESVIVVQTKRERDRP